MRVLMLNHNQERFGTYFRCQFLAEELAKRGHEVTLVCASGKNFSTRIERRRLSENLTLVTLPRIKYHKYFTGQVARMVIASAHVLRHSYDVLHAFTVAQPQIGIPAYLYHRAKRGALVVDWDDLWGSDGFGRYHPQPVRWVLKTFERRIPLLADKVTVVSHFLKKEAIEAGVPFGKIVLLPNGVNQQAIRSEDRLSARATLNLGEEMRLVVSLGNTYTEGLELLLKGFLRVRTQLPAAQLVLVGAVSVPKNARDDAATLGQHLRIVGTVPYEQAMRYLAAADVVVLPMARDPIEEARFPIRLGDYLAAGRPIVSNAVGEVKLILDGYGCGLTTDPDSADALAEALLAVLQDPGLAERVSDRTRQAAADLAWGRIGDALEATYRTVAQEATS